jgi:uncharacterized protein YndB with AHSA1/START domain
MNTDCIEKKVTLHASLQRVWRAVSDSSEFGSWFGMKFDGPFVAGTAIRGVIVPTTVDPKVAETQKPYTGKPVELQIEKMEPEKLFSFRWHPYAVDGEVDYRAEPKTLVAFMLEESPDGVLLTVTESGFDSIPLERRAAAFAANEGGWEAQMKLIEGYLAHAS